jgi:hypothetical protein
MKWDKKMLWKKVIGKELCEFRFFGVRTFSLGFLSITFLGTFF